ncbi:MAG: peroxiredoxin [Patescibacteria group bacterium]|jgi:peroxiredoxin Q/BCP
MIKINTKAPEFTLFDQAGEQHSLNDYLGKWVLLYFYPKDDTPGCTKEACSFRDNLPVFNGLNLQVLGISTDSVDSHRRFAEKNSLNFTILSDTLKQTLKNYDAGGVFTKRISYLINPEGVISKIYTKVNPSFHAEEVKNDLSVLQNKSRSNKISV